MLNPRRTLTKAGKINRKADQQRIKKNTELLNRLKKADAIERKLSSLQQSLPPGVAPVEKHVSKLIRSNATPAEKIKELNTLITRYEKSEKRSRDNFLEAQDRLKRGRALPDEEKTWQKLAASERLVLDYLRQVLQIIK